MNPGRQLIQLVIIIIMLSYPCLAKAGWWFSNDSDWDNSGLDLEHSFDRNTVVSVKGTVIKKDVNHSDGPALAEIKTQREKMTLVLGPREYWLKSGLSLNVGDEISVRGSKAQGKNGKIYLIVENISSSSGKETVILRSETGRPSWSDQNRPGRHRMAPMRQFRGGRNR